MEFKQDPEAKVIGTSFHDVTIRESFAFMVKALGEPHSENDPDDKVRYEWVFTNSDGRSVTVYDWKSNSSKPNIWHVGGLNQEDTVLFKHWFSSISNF
jgi:hypothetical protein